MAERGRIETTKTGNGNGAQTILVAPTQKLVNEIVEPMRKRLASQADPRVVALLRQPLGRILSDLDSSDRHVAGLALEALAFKLMRLLDMDYIATRLRAAQTGGAEVWIWSSRARASSSLAGRSSARTPLGCRSTMWPGKSA